MRLFAVAISVVNEYSGRVLDLSWLIAKDVNDAEKQVRAHCKRTFQTTKAFGKWEDLEVHIDEAPTAIQDKQGRPCDVRVAVLPTPTPHAE